MYMIYVIYSISQLKKREDKGLFSFTKIVVYSLLVIIWLRSISA